MHLICHCLKKQMLVICTALVFLKNPVKMPVRHLPAQCFLDILCFFQALGWVSVPPAFQDTLPGALLLSQAFPLGCAALLSLSGRSPLTRAYLIGKEALKAYSLPSFLRFPIETIPQLCVF